ncbi:MAG: hypothetical protein HPZ79_07535 [Oscillospiraceae bacterium]|nr:hypothetical protein [Oscillospiraceae bacterium]
MDVIALILFLVVIVLAFLRKTNVGILALAIGTIAVKLFGLTDKDLISGISSSMFCIMAGLTLLFSIINNTGALQLLARKVVSLAGKRIWVIPITVYAAGFVVAGIGLGASAGLAIIPGLAVSIALQVGYNPVMLCLIGICGLMGGRMTPITPEAAIINNAVAGSGLANVMPTILVCQTLITVIFSCIIFLIYRGYRVKQPTQSSASAAKEHFNKKQVIALCSILLMMALIIFVKVNVGLAAFIAAAILLLLGVADEGSSIKSMPWSTILMILGVGALLDVVDSVGGIRLMSDALSSIMTSKTAVPLMGLSSGLLSLVSNATSVVYPTMMPMCIEIAEQIGGVNPVALMAAVGAGGSLAGISPMSTGGALALAALATTKTDLSEAEQSKAFVQLLITAAIGLVITAIVSGLCCNWIANLMS